MANMHDYIVWRGDIPFEVSQLNKIDSIIFSRASYFPFERLLKEGESATAKELYQKAIFYNDDDYHIEGDKQLLKLMAKSERFKDVVFTNFRSEFDQVRVVQFAAVTIVVPGNIKYIAYRGTDSTLIGWREDFNMTFMKQVPAQKSALDYLNDTKVGLFTKLYIGGHSKGGNLAFYASIYASDKIKRRIIKVDSFDGPGFLEEVVKSKQFQEMKPKLEPYVPQTSIIGRFLNSDEDYITVKSTEKAILQHDVYTWEVEGKEFLYLDDVDNDSVQIDKVITDWLKQLSFEDRERMVDIIFEMLSATEVRTLKELRQDWYKSMSTIYTEYKKVSPEDKEMLDQVSDILFKAFSTELFTFNRN